MRMNRLVHAFILGLLVLFAIAARPKTPVTTEEASSTVQSACLSLDIIVLVDQSRSMFQNDPYQFRIQVLSHIVEYLADLSLFFCPGAKHRIAIVGFGDLHSDWTKDVVRYMDEAIAPSNVETWETLRAQLYSKLPEPEDMGSTDFLSAFREANQIFQEWKQQPLDSPYPRRKVIFVITDGGPCVVDDGCLRDNIAHYDMRKAMQQVATYIQQHFQWRGIGSEYSVFLVGMALNDLQYDYWKIVGPLWQDIAQQRGGQFLPVSTERPENQLLVRRVYDLLSLVAPFPFDKASCRQDIIIPPYRGKTVSFHIWRFPSQGQETPPLTTLTLQTPEQEIRFYNGAPNMTMPAYCNLSDYYQPTRFSERYLFQPACPGVYRIEIERALQCNVEIYYTQGPTMYIDIAPTMENTSGQPPVLPVVDIAPYYNEALKPRFRVQMQYSEPNGATPVAEIPNYPLLFCVRVTQPNNKVRWYTEFTSQQPGLFESTEYIQTPVEGAYQVEMFVFTRSPKAVVEGSFASVTDREAFCAQATQGNIPEGWVSVLVKSVEEKGEVYTKTRSIKTSFEARKVPRFSLHWEQPLAEGEVETLPLARVHPDGQVTPLPINVQVRVLRMDTGQPLDVFEPFSDPAKSLQAELYPEADPASGVRALLQPAEETGLFRGVLRPRQEWREGRYRLQVSVIGELNTLRWTPATKTIVLEFNGYFIRQLQSQIELPEYTFFAPWSSPTNFWQTLLGKPLPLEIRLTFMHQDEPIPLNQLFEEPFPSLQGTLRMPDGTERQITFSPQKTGYVAIIETLSPREGQYTLSLSLENLALKPGYEIPAEHAQMEHSFTVEIPVLNQPWVVRGAAALGVIFGILVGVIIWKSCFSGPTGILEIIDEDHDEIVGGPWELKKWFTCLGRNRYQLGLEEIARIKVSRAYTEYDEEEKRTIISVTVYDSNGEIVFEDELEPGSVRHLVDSYSVRYVGKEEIL